MADTKNSDLTAITSTDGTEELYASKGGVSGKIPIDTLCSRAALFVSVPESVYLYVTTTDATPTDLTVDGTGIYNSFNGASVDNGIGPSIFGYTLEVIASSGSDHYCAVSNNAASYDASGPSSALLGTDTFTTVYASGGASGWSISTVVNSSDMSLYFQVIGAVATPIKWALRLTPVRTQ